MSFAKVLRVALSNANLVMMMMMMAAW
jgi:hypothetical protein